VTENSTTFEIGLLVLGLIAPLDPKAGIVLWRATMPPAGAGNVRCPAHFRRSANNWLEARWVAIDPFETIVMCSAMDRPSTRTRPSRSAL
jgi:hypothetical protein